MGLPFSEEAEPMDADPAVLEYFIFSFTADFGEVIQDLINQEIIGFISIFCFDPKPLSHISRFMSTL